MGGTISTPGRDGIGAMLKTRVRSPPTSGYPADILTCASLHQVTLHPRLAFWHLIPRPSSIPPPQARARRTTRRYQLRFSPPSACAPPLTTRYIPDRPRRANFNARASAVSYAIRKLHSAWRARPGADLARAFIAAYRLTLSPIIGNNCRHLPTCSQYADEAIGRHGLWAGGWMTFARLLRCQPFGTSGLDFVARTPRESAKWYLPWRYGQWRGVNDQPG
jgi:uncharacterized protein